MTFDACLSRTVNVAKGADVALVVVAMRRLTGRLGLDEVRAAQLATAASELATNIAKYARRGTLELRAGETESRRWVTITAIDQGPGIADIEAAMQNHYSTGGSLGLGLPGVKRLMDEFHIESERGHGCVIRSRMWLND